MNSYSSWAIRLALVLGGASVASTACSSSGGSSGGTGGGVAQTPGQQLCASIASYVQKCGPATPCDQALVDDCAKVVGLLSDSYLSSARDCVTGGGSPTGCLASSFGGLQPSEAQKKFAATFCSDCTGGVVPQCEQLFFAQGGSVPDQLKVAGKVILPLSDTLVSALETECASANPLTCVANFSTCAQGVLAKQAVPSNTAECLLNTLVSGDSTSTGGGSCQSDGGGSGGAGGASGGAGGNSGTGASGGVSGGGGTSGTGATGGTGGTDAGVCGNDLYFNQCAAVGFADPNCDSCSHNLCCSAIEQCLADQECASLVECIATQCASAADPNQCASDTCGQCVTQQASIDLYNGISDCLTNNCASECGL